MSSTADQAGFAPPSETDFVVHRLPAEGGEATTANGLAEPPPVTVSGWARSRRKRAVDISVAVVLFPVAAVIILILGVLSAIRFRAWPIFTQSRRGLDGQTFVLHKIRSLPTDWDPSLGKHDLDHAALPRISRLIRHAHLDELPQLWCVITGTMSIVGPRPMIDEVLERIPTRARIARTRVRPGLTGLWQVSSMGPAPLEECPGLDIDYVETASPGIDLWILRATIAGLGGATPADPSELASRARR